MTSYVRVQEQPDGSLTKSLRVGLEGPFDNVWLHAFGIDLFFEAGRDSNLRAVFSRSSDNPDQEFKIWFRPKADGINDFVMTRLQRLGGTTPRALQERRQPRRPRREPDHLSGVLTNHHCRACGITNFRSRGSELRLTPDDPTAAVPQRPTDVTSPRRWGRHTVATWLGRGELHRVEEDHPLPREGGERVIAVERHRGIDVDLENHDAEQPALRETARGGRGAFIVPDTEWPGTLCHIPARLGEAAVTSLTDIPGCVCHCSIAAMTRLCSGASGASPSSLICKVAPPRTIDRVRSGISCTKSHVVVDSQGPRAPAGCLSGSERRRAGPRRQRSAAAQGSSTSAYQRSFWVSRCSVYGTGAHPAARCPSACSHLRRRPRRRTSTRAGMPAVSPVGQIGSRNTSSHVRSAAFDIGCCQP